MVTLLFVGVLESAMKGKTKPPPPRRRMWTLSKALSALLLCHPLIMVGTSFPSMEVGFAEAPDTGFWRKNKEEKQIKTSLDYLLSLSFILPCLKPSQPPIPSMQLTPNKKGELRVFFNGFGRLMPLFDSTVFSCFFPTS
jgi:hypothetical protein